MMHPNMDLKPRPTRLPYCTSRRAVTSHAGRDTIVIETGLLQTTNVRYGPKSKPVIRAASFPWKPAAGLAGYYYTAIHT